MYYARFAKNVILFTLLIMIVACKSKQETPAARTAAAPREQAGSPAVPSNDKTAARVASPQDKADIRAAAAHVLAQMQTGDFAAIYNEASPGFKQIGTESKFVAKFQQARQKVGTLKNPKELSFDTRPDASHVLVYRLESERYKSTIRLTFTRSQSGKVELAGLNQHDEGTL